MHHEPRLKTYLSVQSFDADKNRDHAKFIFYTAEGVQVAIMVHNIFTLHSPFTEGAKCTLKVQLDLE